MSARCTKCLLVAVTVGLVFTGLPRTVLAGDAYTGEVVTERVNVRSGPSTNYYIVARLKAGDRIDVVDQESGWLAIVPPADCYSLISKDYVDIDAKGNGVVNGDNVRVRAGSDIDHGRYAVQGKLAKGAEVRVIGDTGDGFLKIASPPGVYVWVHSDYIARVPEVRLQQQPAAVTQRPAAVQAPPAETPRHETSTATTQVTRVTNPPLTKVTQEETDSSTMAAIESRIDEPAAEPSVPSNDPADLGVIHRPPPASALVELTESEGAGAESAGSVDSATDNPISALSATEHRDRLEQIDIAMKAEMDKPVADRHLEQVLADYRALAGENLDHVTALFVQRRIEQVEAAATTADAVRQIRSLSTQVTQDRKDALAGRANIQTPVRGISRGLDAKGELRESMIYSSPVGPRRYRLIDPNQEIPRTLCYVEVPRDLPIDIELYLGRLVGVRASEKYLETGDVNPIPVIVAAELVPLDEPRSSARTVNLSGTSAASAVPASVPAAAPVTTPAAVPAGVSDEPERITVVTIEP